MRAGRASGGQKQRLALFVRGSCDPLTYGRHDNNQQAKKRRIPMKFTRALRLLTAALVAVMLALPMLASTSTTAEARGDDNSFGPSPDDSSMLFCMQTQQDFPDTWATLQCADAGLADVCDGQPLDCIIDELGLEGCTTFACVAQYLSTVFGIDIGVVGCIETGTPSNSRTLTVDDICTMIVVFY